MNMFFCVHNLRLFLWWKSCLASLVLITQDEFRLGREGRFDGDLCFEFKTFDLLVENKS